LGAAEREQLAAIVADCNRPRKHVERPDRAGLGRSARGAVGGAKHRRQSADGVGWQQRFAESGVEGLLRDKTRKPGKAPIVAETSADRHIEFIRFLNAHRARGPAGKVIHAVLNNYATPAGRTAKREIGRAAAAAAQNVNAYPRSTLCGV
jgi:hypothetical protein